MSPKISYQEHLLHQITNRIRRSLELSEILNTATQEIQLFLKIDRVKVYRFEADGSGEVVAETIHENRLPSLLNLRFPASDIPDYAREMFIKVRQRVIIDIDAHRRTVNNLDAIDTGEALPHVDTRYATVDPCHTQYLLTMGVRSSLVLPILCQRHLWGLLAIHHARRRIFSERELQVVQLIADQLSIAIAQSELLSRARQQAQYEAIINHISSLLHSPLKSEEIRQHVLEESVKALNGSGGRLYVTSEPTGELSQVYTWGEQPNEPYLEDMPIWQELVGLKTTSPLNIDPAELLAGWEDYEQSLFNPSRKTEAATSTVLLYTLEEIEQQPQLHTIAAAFSATPIRSLAIIPLQFNQQIVGCLSIFRNGHDTEICWAGRWQTDDRNRLPRNSFEAWREVKENQAPQWHENEAKLAEAIGFHLYMAVTQKRIEAIIRYQASHDALTRLPNRLLFDQQLALALAIAKQHDEMLGVAFVDLDRFKVINDTLGHAIGDQLLCEVAERLTVSLRPCDAIARWGGDEFTLLLPHLSSAEDITKISQRILEQLSTPFHLSEQEFYVTASLGIALAPYDGEDAETLLKHADTAMYRAKQAGKNTFHLYCEEGDSQALERFALESDLRKALDRNELSLFYQPQIDLKTGSILGVEALLRWFHPRSGFISPAEFIPLAEETGLISAIGAWVIRVACLQHQQWIDQGLAPLRVAVNLSAQQFQKPDLVKTVLHILEETGIQPSYLELEITESAAMRDVDFTISMLSQFQQMGVQITMDDFGTGYSSLSVIKHFPLDTLKIDKSFVQDAIHNPRDAAIASTVVALGKGLNLEVLAEGVETEEQLHFLQSIGCDSAQGYFFSRPVPPETVVNFLNQQCCKSTSSTGYMLSNWPHSVLQGREITP